MVPPLPPIMILPMLPTLGMLIHGAGGGPHSRMPPWPHSHSLHLPVARILRHRLLVHRIQGLQEGKILGNQILIRAVLEEILLRPMPPARRIPRGWSWSSISRFPDMLDSTCSGHKTLPAAQFPFFIKTPWITGKELLLKPEIQEEKFLN